MKTQLPGGRSFNQTALRSFTLQLAASPLLSPSSAHRFCSWEVFACLQDRFVFQWLSNSIRHNNHLENFLKSESGKKKQTEK